LEDSQHTKQQYKKSFPYTYNHEIQNEKINKTKTHINRYEKSLRIKENPRETI
jgi:hypothetical protein